MDTKKTLVAVIAAMLVVAGLTACQGKGGRKQIDTFLKDYEKFVEKVEIAAKEGKLSSVMSLQTEALKLVEKATELEGTSGWSVNDAEKYLKLTDRYTEAMFKMTNSTDSTESMGLFDSLLNGLF